jgi:hypothetical protein
MTATPRVLPYLWVSWLARFLVGDRHCLWAAWFMAHHSYMKRGTGFDAIQWQIDHTTVVNDAAMAARAAGYHVALEEQNAIRLERDGYTLGGKPDLVLERDGRVRIIDCKSGRRAAWHAVQVMIYGIVLPLARDEYRTLAIEGCVRYADGGEDVLIPADAMGDTFATLLWTTVDRLISSVPPERVPSSAECAMCSITHEDCPERIDEHVEHTAITMGD